MGTKENRVCKERLDIQLLVQGDGIIHRLVEVHIISKDKVNKWYELVEVHGKFG